MKKEKNIDKASDESLRSDFVSAPMEKTDQEILEQIQKRNAENKALKKLLENLNTVPKPEVKS
jgi:hypothetical protein